MVRLEYPEPERGRAGGLGKGRKNSVVKLGGEPTSPGGMRGAEVEQLVTPSRSETLDGSLMIGAYVDMDCWIADLPEPPGHDLLAGEGMALLREDVAEARYRSLLLNVDEGFNVRSDRRPKDHRLPAGSVSGAPHGIPD